MKNLIFIGAGDAAMEIHAWSSPFFASCGYDFKGFIDDNSPKAISTIKDYLPKQNDVFICAIASPAELSHCTNILRSRNANFINLIHPSAIILSSICSTGVIVSPFVYISNNVTINNDVFINVSSSVGHDVQIGEASVLSSHVDLTGHVIVEESVFFGSHACVIPGRRIGHFAIVGAGSMVSLNVKPYTTVLGVPAKELFKRIEKKDYDKIS